MKLHIDRIPEKGLTVSETRPPAWLTNFEDLKQGGSESIESPVRFEARIERFGSRVRIDGEISVTVKCHCSRCTAPFEYEIKAPLDAYFVPENKRDDFDDDEEEDDGCETYRGDELDLSYYLRGQLALHYPMKFLCKTDCKGLCPTCGADLNREKCSCGSGIKDPRWSALNKLKF